MKRQKLTEETINKIKSFYCDDEFSRQFPGKKDYVSIGRNNHVAQRFCYFVTLKNFMLLSNVPIQKKKWIFKVFRPSIKMMYSGRAQRSHWVCVCTIHQNLKLMLSTIYWSREILSYSYWKDSMQQRVQNIHDTSMWKLSRDRKCWTVFTWLFKSQWS